MSDVAQDIAQQARALRRRWIALWVFYCVLTAFGEWSWLWAILAIVCSIVIFATSILIIDTESSEGTS